MKDIAKSIANAKSFIASMNPRREKIDAEATHWKEKLSGVKVESKNETIQQTKESILSAAKQRLENFDHKRENQEVDDRDLSVEVTHAKYNASLLELDSRTMQYTIKRAIDLTDAVNKSREYKKRLRHMLTACAHKDASKLDKALAALQAHMKANQPDAMTVAEIQKIMAHGTPTQASYFKNFAHSLGVVTASRSNQMPMEVNKDSEVYKDFIAL